MASQNLKRTSGSDSGEKRRQVHSRMNFRLSSEVKDRVARAAALAGQDLTEFAVTTLSEKADAVLARHESLLLNQEEYRFFLNALDDEMREPSEKSRAAAEKYRRGSRKGVRYIVAD